MTDFTKELGEALFRSGEILTCAGGEFNRIEMPYDRLLKLEKAARILHRLLTEGPTGEAWSIGRTEFKKYAGRFAERSYEDSEIQADIAPTAIFTEMLNKAVEGA